MYQDPYSNYGRLENEMWLAIRLVVDTGVYSKHGTRQQMVDYFHKYTAMDEPNVQTEMDRYIAWLAQVLAYKLGQLEILKLRQLAKDALGEDSTSGVPRRSAGRRGAAPECAGCAGDGLGEHAEVGDAVKCVLESGWSPGPSLVKSDGGHLLLKYWEPLYRLPR
jgi:hypothetical protein